MLEAKKTFVKKSYRTVVWEGKKVRLRSAQIDYIIEHATPSDIEKFQGVVFEPPEPPHITRRRLRAQIDSLETQRAAIKQQHGPLGAGSEYQLLTAELQRTKDLISHSKRQ